MGLGLPSHPRPLKGHGDCIGRTAAQGRDQGANSENSVVGGDARRRLRWPERGDKNPAAGGNGGFVKGLSLDLLAISEDGTES